MPRPRIFQTMAEAVADFPDGASLMIPGFGPGAPLNLLTALYEQGATGITAISNAFGAARIPEATQIGQFIAAGRVKKAIASFTQAPHPSMRGPIDELIASGKVEAEIVPQGTLAERIRAGGAGIPAFFTPAGVGTLVAEGKEHREFDGERYVMERALFADYAFIRAHRADEAGNLIYRMAARNFNPIMAMAARQVIVEVEEPIVPAGTFPPDKVHTPGVYVHRLVQIPPDGIFGVDLVKLREMAMTPAGTPARRSSSNGPGSEAKA